MQDHIRIVPARAEHLNYIRKSFTTEYSRLHHIPPNAAYSKLDTLMNAWNVVVAVTDHSGDEILGWMLYKDHATIGWVHVKPIYRRHGVARHLLHSIGVVGGSVVDVAFFCLKSARLAKEKGITVRWKPYIVETEQENWLNIVRMIDLGCQEDNPQRNGTEGALPEREIE